MTTVWSWMIVTLAAIAITGLVVWVNKWWEGFIRRKHFD